MPSSILIDFDGMRKEFEAPDVPGPWQKGVEVVVGDAPIAKVTLMSETKQELVKTFKFRTNKRRRVVITVTVDANNETDASLLTVEADGVAIDDAHRHEIVTLDSNAECYLYTKTSETVIVPRSSDNGATLEQIDAAAVAAAAIAPPCPGRVAVMAPYTNDFTIRSRMYQALEAVGYTKIHCPEMSSPFMTSALHGLKPKHEIGDLVGVLYCDSNIVMVCRKTQNGYDFVDHPVGPQMLRLMYPQVKQLIGFLSSVEPVPESKLRLLAASFDPIPVSFVNYEGSYMLPYLWNMVESGNMDGYLVTTATQCSFRICYKRKERLISAETDLLPWAKTVKVNVGDAAEVTIYMKFQLEEALVKQFKFKEKKNRKVSISISIDDARLPKIELVTL
uniref:Tudor domain-containing protein n=1 Tax=Panagrellus redivivus TaxID=6233 RepID=A0A7E4W5C4_PANRE